MSQETNTPSTPDAEILPPLNVLFCGFDECEPGYILGECHLFGVLHHVELLRVVVEDCVVSAWEPPQAGGDEKKPWRFSNNNDTRLERLKAMDTDSAYLHTIQIPELDGDWLMYMLPSQG